MRKGLLFARYVSTAMTLSICLSATAQERPRPYSISGLVDRALGRYELIASRESVIRQHAALERQARRWNNPELGFELGNKTTDGRSGRVLGLSITQRIPFPGKKALAAEIEFFERNRAMLERDEMRLFVRYEVVRLAYEYVRAYQRASHIRERLARLRLISSYMRGRIIVSPQKIVEKQIITYRIAVLDQELFASGSDLRTAYARLNLYIDLAESSPPPISAAWFARPPALALSDLLAKAGERSFALRMQKEALKASGREAVLASREIYPDIGVSLFYNREDAGPAETVFGGGVSLPIPVLSRNRDGAERFREKEREQEILARHAAKVVDSRVRELFARYELAAAKIERFPVSGIEDLERAMRYADAEFRKGRVSLATYLEMDTQTHEMLEMIYSSQIGLVRTYTSLLFMAAEEKDVGGDAG